jgi:hypothetical protein
MSAISLLNLGGCNRLRFARAASIEATVAAHLGQGRLPGKSRMRVSAGKSRYTLQGTSGLEFAEERAVLQRTPPHHCPIVNRVDRKPPTAKHVDAIVEVPSGDFRPAAPCSRHLTHCRRRSRDSTRRHLLFRRSQSLACLPNLLASTWTGRVSIQKTAHFRPKSGRDKPRG